MERTDGRGGGDDEWRERMLLFVRVRVSACLHKVLFPAVVTRRHYICGLSQGPGVSRIRARVATFMCRLGLVWGC